MKALSLILKTKKFFAPAFLFLSLNLCVGTWAVGIPQIKSNIQFSESELGVAILFLGLGTFVMLFLAPKLINIIGLGKTCLYASLLVCVSFVFPFIANTYIMLCLSLFILGLSTGLTDIGMNTLVSQTEQDYKVNIMSASHGFFSLGGVISGALGAFCLSEFTIIPLGFVVVLALLLILLNLYFAKFYLKTNLEHSENPSFDFSYIKPLLVLLVVGFICMAAEGAVADWSALYLRDVSKAEPVWFAFGFLSFSVFMTLGRFLGDNLSDKFGSYKVLYIGLLGSIIGYIFVLLKSTIWSVLGFGLIGFGLSVVIPELFRISGQYKQLEKSRAISLVAGAGYIGFLIGPVLFGFIAEETDLWWSFLCMMIVVFGALVYSYLGKKPTH
jgi:MFS family permease